MEETIEFYKNDTVRVIEKQIEYLKEWRINNSSAWERETEQVILKLEEARYWAMQMVNRH